MSFVYIELLSYYQQLPLNIWEFTSHGELDHFIWMAGFDWQELNWFVFFKWHHCGLFQVICDTLRSMPRIYPKKHITLSLDHDCAIYENTNFERSPGICTNHLEKNCYRWGQRKENLGGSVFHSIHFSFRVRTIEAKDSSLISYYQQAWVAIQPTSGLICNCRWLSWEQLGIVSLTIASSLNVWTALYLGTFDIHVACALCWFLAAYQ